MLSIGVLGRGQGNYYVSLTQEQGEYYTEGGEPPGRWRGQGAETLGLSNLVNSETFLNVFEGFSPGRERALTQNAGLESRQPGWDLTFSAPKSVSVLWSQADTDTRDAIEWAHELAVEKALEYLEQELMYSRRGKGGREQENVEAVIATFDHGTSRAQDPQLHTHCLVLNIGVREDGTTGSLLSHPFYEQKMLLGAIYRAELALQLEKQTSLHSLANERTFEVAGVPKELCDEFSKRREAIERALEEKGQHSAQASSWAALQTRAVKDHVARADLFPFWQETGREYGFAQNEVIHLRQFGAEKIASLERDREEEKAVSYAASKLTKETSYFSERELLQHTLYYAPSMGFGLEEAKSAVREALDHDPQFVRIGMKEGIVRYTTQEVLNQQKEMLNDLEAARPRHEMPTIEERRTFNPFTEQGQITITESGAEAKASLFSEWKKDGIAFPERNLILAGSRAEAKELNFAAQEKRKQKGALGEEGIQIEKIEMFREDRALFTKNDRTLGVHSGDFGTIEEIFPERNCVAVRLDATEKEVMVPLSDYPHLLLGYATTPDKARKDAIENTFVLGGEAIISSLASGENILPTASKTHLYVERGVIAEYDLQYSLSHERQDREQEAAPLFAQPEEQQEIEIW